MNESLSEFLGGVWIVDFEFKPCGEQIADVHCMVAREFFSGRSIFLSGEELRRLHAPPFDIGENALVVAYAATAELLCFRWLGWPEPVYVLDLFFEFRNHVNGRLDFKRTSLLDALNTFGIESVDPAYKRRMRDLAIRGGPFSKKEDKDLLEYCDTDVFPLIEFLKRFEPHLDLPRALLRGQYAKGLATMLERGVPIDTETLGLIQKHQRNIKTSLIKQVDEKYGVFDGNTFKLDRFEAYLAKNSIAWPTTPTGKPKTDKDTFKEMRVAYPETEDLGQLKSTLGQMRMLFDKFPISSDGRNRCYLDPFKAKTGRNQPSSASFIFGFPAWFRALIKPLLGMAVAYIDWSQQEWAIAAAKSGDVNMMEDYEKGDAYLQFAIRAGAIPLRGTKQSHKAIREQYKQCALAVNYGMGRDALALRIGGTATEAANLLQQHRETYPVFWKWMGNYVDHGLLSLKLETCFGWRQDLGKNRLNARSIMNFPMQSDGAEMLRIACILAYGEGIPLCAPVHDALLIEDTIDMIDETVLKMQRVMEQASVAVTGELKLRTDVQIIRYPDRFQDERGAKMWDLVAGMIRVFEK